MEDDFFFLNRNTIYNQSAGVFSKQLYFTLTCSLQCRRYFGAEYGTLDKSVRCRHLGSPRPNPPELLNPRWRRNTKMCTHAPEIRLHCRLTDMLMMTYFSVWPWKLYKALAKNCGLLASLLAASSSSLLLLSSSASYSLLSRSSSCLLLISSSSSSSRLLLSSSSLRLCSSSSFLLRVASSSRLLNTSSSDGGCCRICSSSDAVRVGPWVEYQKINLKKL